ncbi:MAG: hypothetical protein GXP32_04565 [Kiritimatiellaeota bacterium]|nr:hypothetical protein [Kiritimatiellota bacterium]
METYLYLSMLPETLTASMLPPKEFGTYLAVGSQQKLPRETMYFSLKSEFESDFFDFKFMKNHCVPHRDGRLKKSLYLGVYRVLEHVPMSAIDNLFLVTRDGRVLKLSQGDVPEDGNSKYHLYSEVCPTTPLVVSRLQPAEFCSFITTKGHSLHIPKICFMEMLAPMPKENQPLDKITSIDAHIIEGYKALENRDKKAKVVDRRHQISGWGRGIKDGFYLADKDNVLFFPFPSVEKLKESHYDWFKSANL